MIFFTNRLRTKLANKNIKKFICLTRNKWKTWKYLYFRKISSQ